MATGTGPRGFVGGTGVRELTDTGAAMAIGADPATGAGAAGRATGAAG